MEPLTKSRLWISRNIQIPDAAFAFTTFAKTRRYSRPSGEKCEPRAVRCSPGTRDSGKSKRSIAKTVLSLVSRVAIRYCNVACIHLGFVSLERKRGETNKKPGKEKKDVRKMVRWICNSRFRILVVDRIAWWNFQGRVNATEPSRVYQQNDVCGRVAANTNDRSGSVSRWKISSPKFSWPTIRTFADHMVASLVLISLSIFSLLVGRCRCRYSGWSR